MIMLICCILSIRILSKNLFITPEVTKFTSPTFRIMFFQMNLPDFLLKIWWSIYRNFWPSEFWNAIPYILSPHKTALFLPDTWSVIALLLEEPNLSVKYFRIATSLYAKMSSNIRCKIILPLLIRTETHTYFFSIVSMSPDNCQISRIFHDWYYFQRTYEDPITFVLVVNDCSSLHTAWQYLLKETVLNPRISFDHIRFSVVHSWFLPNPGILLTKDDLNFWNMESHILLSYSALYS